LYVCAPVVVTERKESVPAPVEVKLVSAVEPPTAPLNVLVPVDVTVSACAPLTVLPKEIAAFPVVTLVVPPSVTAPVLIENALLVVV
jgi:hypothetical protein